MRQGDQENVQAQSPGEEKLTEHWACGGRRTTRGTDTAAFPWRRGCSGRERKLHRRGGRGMGWVFLTPASSWRFRTKNGEVEVPSPPPLRAPWGCHEVRVLICHFFTPGNWPSSSLQGPGGSWKVLGEYGEMSGSNPLQRLLLSSCPINDRAPLASVLGLPFSFYNV